MKKNKTSKFIIHAWNGNDIIKFDDYSGEFILDLASYCDNMTFSVSLSEFERKQFAEELSKIISIMK